MYKRIITVFLMLAVAACSPGNDKADKKAEKLADLKKQKEKLDNEISKLEDELDTGGAAANVITVGIQKPAPEQFQHFIQVQGKVESDQNILVTPKMPGAMVTDIRVKTGDHVSKGQVLAQLDAGVMSQSIQELKGQLELAHTVYEKQKNLWNQKIGSEIQYLTAKNNYEALQNRLATMQQQLSLYTLRAPIDGSVDDVNLKVGEIPLPGIAGIRVVNPKSIKITAEVSERYISRIHKGDHVVVSFPDLGKEITTKVRTVSDVINATNRTFSIELDPEIRNLDLHPNMIAVVKVNDYTNKNVIALPVNVVQKDDNGNFVYVAVRAGDQYIARKKSVHVGQDYAGKVEILSGLSADDQVIVNGYQSVVEGQPVNI